MNKIPYIEHKFKHTPIILTQRYYNHRKKRVETLVDVKGSKCVTNMQTVHIDYFRDIYTLKR